MGISMSQLLRSMYKKWLFSYRYGIFEYLIILFGLMNTKNIFESKKSSFFIYLIPVLSFTLTTFWCLVVLKEIVYMI